MMGSPLPLDARIKARDTESPVGELPGHLHLPDGLRRRGLGHLVDRRVLSRKCRSAFVELDVAVGQQARVAPKGEKTGARSSTHSMVAVLADSSSWKMGTRLTQGVVVRKYRRWSPGRGCRHCQTSSVGKFICCVRAGDVGIVLLILPVNRIGAVHS